MGPTSLTPVGPQLGHLAADQESSQQNTKPPSPTNSTSQLPFPPSTPPISHREARKAKKNPSTSPNASITTTETSIAPSPRAIALTPKMPPNVRFPMFIASIGNPEPAYLNTLHSAGHTLLDGIHAIHPNRFQDFARSKTLGNGLAAFPPPPKRHFIINSVPDDWVLWKSSSLMNISGKGLASAFKTWQGSKEGREDAVLVVLHDELEKEFGKWSLKWEGSPKGHNGLKSVISSLGKQRFARIGVGIGRPASREPQEVAKYVMRRMKEKEIQQLHYVAGDILLMLREVEAGDA